MTPIALLTVLALTWLSMTILDWLLPLAAQSRILMTLALLVIYVVWVIGLPLIVVR